MDKETPPPSAARVLLCALVELAEEKRDVREALLQVSGWLNTHLGQSTGGGDGEADMVVQLRQDRRVEERGMREVDLDLVSRRARWKARASRFAAERASEATPGPEREQEFISRERELRLERDSIDDCFGWMLDPYRRLPDGERMEQIACCYDNVALAAEVTLRLDGEGVLEPGPPSELLYLLAESQSALLAGLGAVDLRGDSDQRDLFLWLKHQTTRHRIYVDRHMRLDDPADFRAHTDLASRLRKTSEGLFRRREAKRQRGQLLNKVRYHMRRVAEGESFAEPDHDSIRQTVASWHELGLPPGDRALRELLEPLAKLLPEGTELGPEIKRVIESQPTTFGADAQDSAPRPDLVERASALLEGRSVLLFSPEEDSGTGDELIRTLELAGLKWVVLPQEDTDLGGRLEAEIRDTSISLVLIAVRLGADEYSLFKNLCIELDKPFVRLPSGTGPPQVAHQVLRQVGRRLRGPGTDQDSGPGAAVTSTADEPEADSKADISPESRPASA